jgi:sulfite exporter TauE/SafE
MAHRQPGNARAGYIYLLMASLGTLSLLLSFGLLAGRWLRVRRIRDTQLPTVASAVLALALLGAAQGPCAAVWLSLA